MRWVDATKRYLGAIASKDIDTLEYVLDDDVRMTCWSCDVTGKEETLKTLNNFIDFVKDIKIHIQNPAYHNKYVCVELELSYTRIKKIKVVSHIVYIIEFDDWGKIKLMRIYRMKEGEE